MQQRKLEENSLYFIKNENTSVQINPRVILNHFDL